MSSKKNNRNKDEQEDIVYLYTLNKRNGRVVTIPFRVNDLPSLTKYKCYSGDDLDEKNMEDC